MFPLWVHLLKYGLLIMRKYPQMSEDLTIVEKLLSEEIKQLSEFRRNDKYSYLMFLLEEGKKQGLLTSQEKHNYMHILAVEELG